VPRILEHPPSTQKTSMVGTQGGSDREPGPPTINARNVDGRPPWGGGTTGLHPGFERCVVNLNGYDRQKVILLTSLIHPALSPVMAYNP
jgi:hypothetical protein